MEQELSLVQKLAKIRAICDSVKKSKKGFNYTYSDITDILAKVTAGMQKYGVSLFPSIVPGTTDVTQNVIHNVKYSKTGDKLDTVTTEMLVTGEMVFRWVNDDNPEDFLESTWFVTGSQTDPSQAFGSGLTYCTRYYLCNFFQIAQSDTDPDAYRSKQRAAAESEDRAVAENIIAEFNKALKIYLSTHPDQEPMVKKLVGKYVKSGNYFTIKDPALAAKLFEEFNKVFLGIEG